MVTIRLPTGTINLGSMSGLTGMNRSPPKCEVCGKYVSDYIDCNINFDQEITSSNDVHRVCPPCYDTTKKLLRKVKRMKLIELPLHINDKNIFVEEAVNNRLDGKWVCKL